MAADENNLADRSGRLFESHKGYDPRLVFFYFITAGLLLVLLGGLAFQQLFKSERHHDRERTQNQRRILVPGPRGNIYDRNHQLLVGNRPRLAIVLDLAELRPKFRTEFLRIRKNYRETGDKELPTADQLQTLARVSVVQSYLAQVNAILGRDLRVDAGRLNRHFARELLLPYPLVEDLAPADYARLIERLPVISPLQLYTTNTREYPFGSAAAHTLGYVGIDEKLEVDDFPGSDLTTFRMRGSVGRDGLERRFDEQLQGEAGGSIFRVDPLGYRIRNTKPIESRLPKQGKNLITSLDIDLQIAADKAIGDQVGAAVAIDVATGEILVLVSKPDYDLNVFYPRLSPAVYAEIKSRGAEFNRAVSGLYPPGSTFKILTSIAALRRGVIDPDEPIINCQGTLQRFNHRFVCYNGRGIHGEVLLRQAIAESCDIFYYEAGWRTTAEGIAEEARRFRFGARAGIEVPAEMRGLIPDGAWKEKTKGEKWFPGDTANMAIGQGDVLVTPLQMACFTASVARGEVFTRPTLLHDPDRPVQRHESIGLTPAQRLAIFEGMEACTLPPQGTARILTTLDALRVPGVRIAGKTGTAQKAVKGGNINFAWFICFAPIEKPEIAIAIVLEGDTPGEEFGGGRYAGPVASAILKKYFEKKNRPADRKLAPFRTE